MAIEGVNPHPSWPHERKERGPYMDNSFTRDPKGYRPSDHAIQRMKERDVESDAIAETIVNGRVKEKITDEDDDNYGIRLRDQWLQTEYEVVILPPSWINDNTGLVKSCWITSLA